MLASACVKENKKGQSLLNTLLENCLFTLLLMCLSPGTPLILRATLKDETFAEETFRYCGLKDEIFVRNVSKSKRRNLANNNFNPLSGRAFFWCFFFKDIENLTLKRNFSGLDQPNDKVLYTIL